MKKIIKLTAITSAILAPTLVQAQATSPMEVSATVVPGCFIEADNINFGNLITPISTQTAQSDMRVHCSKGASLDIKINYSNSNGSNNSGNYTFTLTYNNVSQGWTAVKLYRDGQPISSYNRDIECGGSKSENRNKVYFLTQEAADLYGMNIGLNDDGYKVCNSAVINQEILASLGTPTKGVLSGLVKGEQIKYSLEKPGSASTIWNSSNGYTLTANGQSQTIPMKANIVSADNPTHRMTPDNYQDTLTVVLTY